jgi:hypothetical protein
MAELTTKAEILRGGQFLVKETNCEDIFTPQTQSCLRVHHFF